MDSPISLADNMNSEKFPLALRNCLKSRDQTVTPTQHKLFITATKVLKWGESNMIKYFFSCIYGTIVLGEFIVQEIHFSLIEDDHIGKSTTKICHQIHLFWKQILWLPPKFIVGTMQIREWLAQVTLLGSGQARSRPGLERAWEPQTPSFYCIPL